jgi:hypothetical protein
MPSGPSQTTAARTHAMWGGRQGAVEPQGNGQRKLRQQETRGHRRRPGDALHAQRIRAVDGVDAWGGLQGDGKVPAGVVLIAVLRVIQHKRDCLCRTLRRAGETHLMPPAAAGVSGVRSASRRRWRV